MPCCAMAFHGGQIKEPSAGQQTELEILLHDVGGLTTERPIEGRLRAGTRGKWGATQRAADRDAWHVASAGFSYLIGGIGTGNRATERSSELSLYYTPKEAY